MRADPFGIVGAEGSLQALCDLAAANPCTVEMASVLFCTTTSSPDYDSLFVEFNGGLYHYLATHEDGIQRVVHLLERVERFATEAAASKVVGVAQWTTPSGIPVVAVTTRASYVNWEAEEALGWDRERLTACFRRSGARVATECGLSVPLYFEQWSGESPDGGFTATDGYVVTRRAIASAVAVPSPDGTLRHTLLGGSWHLLFGGDFFNPDPATLPTAADSILPIGL